MKLSFADSRRGGNVIDRQRSRQVGHNVVDRIMQIGW
jgi:hypothetical protein